jgi:uncharacterized protein (DUF2252 family)
MEPEQGGSTMARTISKDNTKTNSKNDAVPKAAQAIDSTPPATKEELATLEERIAAGKALREAVPRESHSEWKPATNRRDPIEILQDQDKSRVPFLLPIRYGRMLQSPFAFLRGSAAVMAGDLARTPVSGLRVQVCGDCHLVNFGGFATPERNILFDINDFDETLPAPWEWDVKRLAASFIVAGRNNGLSDADSRAATREMVRTYRTQMAAFAQMRVLEVWYAKLDLETILSQMKDVEWAKRIRASVEKAKSRSVAEYEFPKMTEQKEGAPVIKDSPPLIYHPPASFDQQIVLNALDLYRNALHGDRRFLFDRYRYYDIAIKVVGVGSVGTLCTVVLFMASPNDPLFLQIKEANPSVLEPYAGKSRYDNHGERVVTGQRLMQSASDIFLGWTMSESGRHFYVRQLRDMKLKPVVESYNAARLSGYGRATGWTLARAHARSGDAAMISGYLGKGDIFDQAIEKFAVSYADQTERDHEALANAVRSGRIEVQME